MNTLLSSWHPRLVALATRQAAALATRQLVELDFPPTRVSAVAHAIESHSFSAAIRPQTIEAQIVQDADRLDALTPGPPR